MPGDHAADALFDPGHTFTRWYFLSGVDVSGRVPMKTVVAFGDSITDGHGARQMATIAGRMCWLGDWRLAL